LAEVEGRADGSAALAAAFSAEAEKGGRPSGTSRSGASSSLWKPALVDSIEDRLLLRIGVSG